MRDLVVGLVVLLANASFALNAGQKVRVNWDTKLMSGEKVLADVRAGTELDVLSIDPNSGAWFSTVIQDHEATVKGWVRVDYVSEIPGVCAESYAYVCNDYVHRVCRDVWEPVCKMEHVWECKSYFNPKTKKWEKKCASVLKKVCHNVRRKDCFNEVRRYCQCTKAPQ